jgi:hypothetical protein
MIFVEYLQTNKSNLTRLNAPSRRSNRTDAVFAQSAIAQAITSIANPHLNGDAGAIIAFLGDMFELVGKEYFTSVGS